MSKKKKTEEPVEEIVTLDETPEVIEEAAEEAPEAEAQETSESTTEPMAYIGPDIKHIAVKGTVFSNGLPAKLQSKIEEIPAISGLLVPVSKLADSYKQVKTKGTALYNLSETVKEKL